MIFLSSSNRFLLLSQMRAEELILFLYHQSSARSDARIKELNDYIQRNRSILNVSTKCFSV